MPNSSSTALRIYRYRWLLHELVIREMRLRYRGSVLGFAWALLNPLLFMAVYTLVFSVYLRVPVQHYALYLLAGLLPWMWFAGAVQQGASAIVDGRHFVGKTTFPIEILLAVPVCTNGLNFLISLPLLVALALVFHVHFGLALLALPVLIGVQFALTLAIVQLIATLNVFFRDLQQLVVYAVTVLFYLIPIFYTRAQVPPAYAPLIAMNPFAAMISGFQAIFYYGRMPSLADVAFAAATAVVLALLAQGTFLRYREALGQYL